MTSQCNLTRDPRPALAQGALQARGRNSNAPNAGWKAKDDPECTGRALVLSPLDKDALAAKDLQDRNRRVTTTTVPTSQGHYENELTRTREAPEGASCNYKLNSHFIKVKVDLCPVFGEKSPESPEAALQRTQMEALRGCNGRQARQHWGSASSDRAHQTYVIVRHCQKECRQSRERKSQVPRAPEFATLGSPAFGLKFVAGTVNLLLSSF
ncbi:Myosin-Binding Protein C, Cardiac-Type [Manis pentadactyla]|nr:Myosin-Binding Protein C, Cardiac-Type [Manis pentadactyla]